MIRADFVHLRVHSHYSLLDATPRIEDLVETAAEQGYHALSLTDSGNLFGALEFYQTARGRGIKPIIGAELFLTEGPRQNRDKGSAVYNLVTLVQNQTGYRNLIRLVSIGYLEGFYYRPRIDLDCLREFNEGLIALSGNRYGKVSRLLLRGQYDKALAAAMEYKEIFGDRFYLEIQNHGLNDEMLVAPLLLKLSKETNIGLVATNEVLYLRRDDSLAREVLKCIGTGRTVKDVSLLKPETEQHYLKSPAEMKSMFSDLPQAIENSLKIADLCNLELDLSKFHLPRFDLPAGTADYEYLEKLCREEIPKRRPNWDDGAEDRLKFELEVIRKMGFSSYFLIVWDFIRFAKSHDIMVGPGRGSAAGSMVSYLLGITELDPIRFGLFFERFLNPGRASMPDIDIDFCERRRSEVIDYVRKKYGQENVCHIITFGVLKCKAALKDTARVLEVPFNVANQITQAVPPGLEVTLTDALAASGELRKFNDTYKELFKIAGALEGCARHSSTHAAGVVITPDKLWKFIPVYQREDEIATQFTMKWLEKAGILKMDFLGLSTLTVIQLTIQNIRRNRGLVLDIDKIPLNDKKTLKLLASGETSGVFTFETSSFKDLMKRLRPSSFEDLIAAQALGRPGPLQSGMVDEYIAAKHGQQEIKYPHKSLESLLKETNGVFIYQEQVMQCANLLAGYSLSEADGLRKAMGKKIPAEMEKHRERFQKGAVANGISPVTAEEIFSTMEKFAAYGFNKSHSACYALVSYQTAFLKANFSAEFMAALLTIEMNNTDKIAHLIEECARLKIDVAPPSVNESGLGFTVHQRKIRFGLAAIKNLGENVAHAIEIARSKHGNFKNLEDFCKKVDTKTVNRRAVESLIKCGAFHGFPHNRAQLLAVVDQALQLGQSAQKHQDAGQGTLLDFFSTHGGNVAQSLLTYPEIPEFAEREILTFEKEMLGLYLSGHPLLQHSLLLECLNLQGILELETLDDGSTFMIPGIIKTVRKIRTRASGKQMAFVTFEDMRGSRELAIFEETLEKVSDQLTEDNLVLVHGKISAKRDGEKRPVVEGIVPLDNLMTSRNWKAKVFLRSPEENITRDLLAKVRNIILANHGRHQVLWSLTTSQIVATVRLGKAFKVTPNKRFVEAIYEVLGPGSVQIRLEAPQPTEEKGDKKEDLLREDEAQAPESEVASSAPDENLA